jgi:hypothetical protein
MTWESAKHLCADILQKMISKPPTVCSTRAERRARDRWEYIMSMCEDRITLLHTYDSHRIFSADELALLVSQCVVTVDAIRRHEIDDHKSLEE